MLKLSEQLNKISIFFVIILIFSSLVYMGSDNTYGEAVLLEDTEEPEIGDVISSFKKSVTQMKFGEKTIPTYEMNNALCFVVEDLQYYGYRSSWYPKERITRLVWDGKNQNKPGTKKYVKTSGSVYYSDVKIFINGIELPAYNIGGYSLIKFSDLSDITYRSESRECVSEVNISGLIELPDGDRAPADGLVVKPVFFYYKEGALSEIIGDGYRISEDQTHIAYEMTIPVSDDFMAPFTTPTIHCFMGYRIETKENKYVHYNSVDLVFLNRLDYYQDVYSNVNIQLLPKQDVTVSLDLKGDLFGVIDNSFDREISVIATDVETKESISEHINQSVDQKHAEIKLTLVRNRCYSFSFEMTAMGSIYRGGPCSKIDPKFPISYYNDVDRSHIGEIPSPKLVNEFNSVIEAEIQLPNIYFGNAYPSDWQAQINGKLYDVYSINGLLYAVLEAYMEEVNCTYSIQDELDQRFKEDEKDNTANCVGKVVLSNYQMGNEDIFVPVYNLLHTNYYEQLVAIDDLKKIGYKAIVDDSEQSITIIK